MKIFVANINWSTHISCDGRKTMFGKFLKVFDIWPIDSYIVTYQGRCNRTTKSYIDVFVGIGLPRSFLHLELVSELNWDSFATAIRRFVGVSKCLKTAAQSLWAPARKLRYSRAKRQENCLYTVANDGISEDGVKPKQHKEDDRCLMIIRPRDLNLNGGMFLNLRDVVNWFLGLPYMR